MFLSALGPLALPESYASYVRRATDAPSRDLLEQLKLDPAIAYNVDLAPLVAVNSAFLDAATASHGPEYAPSADARIAVPLLLQLVRDWTEHGKELREQCYAPILSALASWLPSTPRVLVPGSGLGRLAYEIAAAHAHASVVAIEPDTTSQIMAAHLMDPSSCEADSTQRTIYPSIHLGPHWEHTNDRLRGVQVPDVPYQTLLDVQVA